MSLFNNPADVIIESSKLDLASASNVLIESTVNSFKETCRAIPTLEEGTIAYTEEVVPVFAYKDTAVVELENVVKFMESNNISDIAEAARRIAEHYNIPEVGIVIESDEELEDGIEEARRGAKQGDEDAIKKMEVATESLKEFKEKGLKLFKKAKKKVHNSSKKKN